MNQLRIGMIGLGQRGFGLLQNVIINMQNVSVTAVCDTLVDRMEEAADFIKKQQQQSIKMYSDYRELILSPEVDAVIVCSDWLSHIEISIFAMEQKKCVGMEVGGAYSVEECYRLVRTYEQTGTPFMFLENCCYGEKEMLISNMVRAGLFGEIVHASGAYGHDLRNEIANGQKIRHYRQINYQKRNCENYPTHELGPIAKILMINRGNRMMTLRSVSSKAVGLRDYILTGKPHDPELDPYSFRQGDFVSTQITCADGSTILLQLNTTLPRPYSRELTVRGTRGCYTELNDCIFLDGIHDEFQPETYNSGKYAEYLPPVWEKANREQNGSHISLDFLVLQEFVNCVLEDKPMPIDVYDAAAWMSVSCLSEQSIQLGGAPVYLPDFTSGKWMKA